MLLLPVYSTDLSTGYARSEPVLYPLETAS